MVNPRFPCISHYAWQLNYCKAFKWSGLQIWLIFHQSLVILRTISHLSIYLSISFVCLSWCLAVCHSETKWGSGSIKVWQWQHQGKNCKKQKSGAWVRKGENTDWWGGRNETRQEEERLRLLSGACLSVRSAEPQPENTDTAAVCISLPFTTVTPVWTAISYVILLFWPIYRVT